MFVYVCDRKRQKSKSAQQNCNKRDLYGTDGLPYRGNNAAIVKYNFILASRLSEGFRALSLRLGWMCVKLFMRTDSDMCGKVFYLGIFILKQKKMFAQFSQIMMYAGKSNLVCFILLSKGVKIRYEKFKQRKWKL